jgi:hypothetical protein
MQKIYDSGLGCVKDVVRGDLDKGVTDFGLRDQKGRACGYEWVIRTVAAEMVSVEEYAAWQADPSHPGGFYSAPAGCTRFFEVWGSPIRNGQPYGPSFNRAWHATLEAAQKAVADRIKNSRKRDTKKFAEFNKEVAA